MTLKHPRQLSLARARGREGGAVKNGNFLFSGMA